MSFAILGDLQTLSFKRGIAEYVFSWLAVCGDEVGLSAVVAVGDITQHGDTLNNTNEFAYMRQNFQLLHDPEVMLKHSVLPGNHEGKAPFVTYNQFFKADEHAQFDLVTMDGNMNNNYFTLEFDTHRWLFLQLQWSPTQAMYDWARLVISEHSTHNVVLSSHYVLDGCTGRIMGQFEDIAANHCNVKMMFSGHSYLCSDEMTVTRLNQCGQAYFVNLHNRQGRENGGDGPIRIYQVDVNADTLHASTWISRLNTFDHSPDSCFSYNFATNTTAPGARDPTCKSHGYSVQDVIIFSTMGGMVFVGMSVILLLTWVI